MPCALSCTCATHEHEHTTCVLIVKPVRMESLELSMFPSKLQHELEQTAGDIIVPPL